MGSSTISHVPETEALWMNQMQGLCRWGLLFRVVLSDAQYHQMSCVFQSNGHVDSGPSSRIVIVLCMLLWV